MKGTTAALARMVAAVPEQRREFAVSIPDLARLAQVSGASISTLEKDGLVDPAHVVRIAVVLTLLELYSPPSNGVKGMVDAEPPTALFHRGIAPAHLGGAA